LTAIKIQVTTGVIEIGLSSFNGNIAIDELRLTIDDLGLILIVNRQ
jgi:hypothetical protein